MQSAQRCKKSHQQMQFNPSLTADPTIFLEVNSGEFGSKIPNISKGEIDLQSIVEILRNAIPFTPHTASENLKMLSLGISAQKVADNFEFNYSFPFKETKYIHTENDLNQAISQYHSLLCKSLERKIKDKTSTYLLQSAGKDSTSLAIALADVNPGANCITYQGGNEENETQSAKQICSYLGLKHHSLISNTTRAYSAYLKRIPRLKSITGDFAFLSYFDILETISPDSNAVIDGLGSDVYFGAPLSNIQRLSFFLALGLNLPGSFYRMPLINKSFKACYLLSTLELDKLERFFPGSRFTVSEINQLLGNNRTLKLKGRTDLFEEEFSSTSSLVEKRSIALSILEAGGAFAKGRFCADSYDMRVIYPFCDDDLASYIKCLPLEFRMIKKTNKVLVRKHIEKHFINLPYVASKGSFRFNLVDFAQNSFDQVFTFAESNDDILPGAKKWLLSNREHLGNKYFASKFYLLAIVLPWLSHHKK